MNIAPRRTSCQLLRRRLLPATGSCLFLHKRNAEGRRRARGTEIHQPAPAAHSPAAAAPPGHPCNPNPKRHRTRSRRPRVVSRTCPRSRSRFHLFCQDRAGPHPPPVLRKHQSGQLLMCRQRTLPDRPPRLLLCRHRCPASRCLSANSSSSTPKTFNVKRLWGKTIVYTPQILSMDIMDLKDLT